MMLGRDLTWDVQADERAAGPSRRRETEAVLVDAVVDDAGGAVEPD